MAEDEATTKYLPEGRTVEARPEHQVVYDELYQLIKRHAGTLTPMDLRAVASNMVGKLVALQDQSKVTPEMAMRVVGHNIEAGNRQAFEDAAKLRELAATPAQGRA